MDGFEEYGHFNWVNACFEICEYIHKMSQMKARASFFVRKKDR